MSIYSEVIGDRVGPSVICFILICYDSSPSIVFFYRHICKFSTSGDPIPHPGSSLRIELLLQRRMDTFQI